MVLRLSKLGSLVLFVALLAGLLMTAMPASAAVPGLVRVAVTGVNDSADFKDVTAFCPPGKQLVGTGAEITGGFGEVGFDDIRPEGLVPTAVTVRAHELDPFALNWSVTAYAICANPLPGLIRVSSTSVTDSADFKDITATCPAGRQMVGTGAEITGGLGEVTFDDLRPNGSPTVAPTAHTVRAHEEDPTANNWSVTSYAICANPLPGLSRSQMISVSDSADFKDIAVTCPTGKRLTGLGGQFTGAGGEVTFDDLRPSGGPATAPVTNTVRGHEEDPRAANWTVTAFAICANA